MKLVGAKLFAAVMAALFLFSFVYFLFSIRSQKPEAGKSLIDLDRGRLHHSYKPIKTIIINRLSNSFNRARSERLSGLSPSERRKSSASSEATARCWSGECTDGDGVCAREGLLGNSPTTSSNASQPSATRRPTLQHQRHAQRQPFSRSTNPGHTTGCVQTNHVRHQQTSSS